MDVSFISIASSSNSAAGSGQTSDPPANTKPARKPRAAPKVKKEPAVKIEVDAEFQVKEKKATKRPRVPATRKRKLKEEPDDEDEDDSSKENLAPLGSTPASKRRKYNESEEEDPEVVKVLKQENPSVESHYAMPAVIARGLGSPVEVSQVETALKLMNQGCTVPFIARYRKEATRGLTDTQLREIESQKETLTELQHRRDFIVRKVADAGNLDKTLWLALHKAQTRVELDELYEPFSVKKSKELTPAQQKCQKLWEEICANAHQIPAVLAQKYVGEELANVKAALDGAAERFLKDVKANVELLEKGKELLWSDGWVEASKARKSAKKEEANVDENVFSDYFSFRRKVSSLASHQAQALFRGERLGVLKLSVAVGDTRTPLSLIAQAYQAWQSNARNNWLQGYFPQAWETLAKKLQKSVFARLREAAEKPAIKVFQDNLQHLLLHPPAGARVVMGIDPGLRTGAKIAVVDRTGKVVATTTVFTLNQPDQAEKTLRQLCDQHGVQLIGVGDGKGSREALALVRKIIRDSLEGKTKIELTMISECGASVYSASELASKEFPDMDVTLRGAVSLARRVQDPLSELVKVPPESLGIGQYQHDMPAKQLATALENTVVDCVNSVGVDLNLASPHLLKYVAGLNALQASNIVKHRDEHGPFDNRQKLLSVKQIGPKAFEQAAGFLRIYHGSNPLDSTSLHPERYEVVTRIAKACGVIPKQLIRNEMLLKDLDPSQFIGADFGVSTVQEIISELLSPSCDPRPVFQPMAALEGAKSISELKIGQRLPGIIANVVEFGAFVDLGIERSGLIHITEMKKLSGRKFHHGQSLVVEVLSVDLNRGRIGLRPVAEI